MPDANDDFGVPVTGVDIGEQEYEVVLREEEVVAKAVTVPKERARLETHVVTEDAEVAAEVRKERVRFEAEDPS